MLDGAIEIYGPKFIVVPYQAAYRPSPPKNCRVLTSIEDVQKHLTESFVAFR